MVCALVVVCTSIVIYAAHEPLVTPSEAGLVQLDIKIIRSLRVKASRSLPKRKIRTVYMASKHKPKMPVASITVRTSVLHSFHHVKSITKPQEALNSH